MSTCDKCGLPAFAGAAGYAGRQCLCSWVNYAPTPTKLRSDFTGCRPVVYVDEQRVREIIREELARLAQEGPKG